MSIFQDFQYCPRCQGKLTQHENYVHCSSCNFQLYDNPRSASGLALQNSDGAYLLFRRAEDPYKGMLDVPGGFVAEHETLLEGARRELKEEVGIEVGKLTYYNSYPDIYPYKDVTYAVLGAVFTGHIDDSHVIQPSTELTEYAFYKLADMPIEEIAFPGMRQLFRNLQEDEARATSKQGQSAETSHSLAI